ncbi:MAG: outer membrane protein assembly factor BamD [Rickettsiaceae bacterium]|nr:outer membrane protein assembly factor BamD [Rickettsiaceae bacterium]
MNFTKLSLLAAVLLLASCKTTKEDLTVTPSDTLYKNAEGFLAQKKYKAAAEEFGKIYFQHPGAEITPQAEIMEAYSLYMEGEYEEAIDVLDIFIRLHPMHQDISYVYYLKGLCYYMEISDSEHDQGKTDSAKLVFTEVINRFPATKYAIDANMKMDLINDHLAGNQMNIGRLYLRKKNPISAIKRFQKVIKEFQTTAHTQEALYRIVECYSLLGLKEEAKKYAAVLGHNYQDSKWYHKAFKIVGGK